MLRFIHLCKRKVLSLLVTFNMYSVQLAVKTQLDYCTVCTMYKKLHVSAYFGHLQVFHIA